MTKNEPIGVTVRLPRPLYKKLTDRAAAEGRSINQELIRLVRESLTPQEQRQEVLLEDLDEFDQQLIRSVANVERLVVDLSARISRLEAGEGNKDVTVTDVAKQPTGAE